MSYSPGTLASPDSLSRHNNVCSAEGVTYNHRGHGVLLLPNGGRSADIIRQKVFEDYIRDHVDNWFNWAQNNRLGVERMEDLILVSGCTSATSWASAAFVDSTPEAEVSLTGRLPSNVGGSFAWGNVGGRVVYHNSHFDSVSLSPFHRLVFYLYSECAGSLFVNARKAKPIHDEGSMRLYQGLPSKAYPLMDQTNPCLGSTPPLRP